MSPRILEYDLGRARNWLGIDNEILQLYFVRGRLTKALIYEG